MTSGSGGIARLGALLGALDPQGPPTGPREVAELLWLAANLPAGALVRPERSSGDAAAAETTPSSPKHEGAAADASDAPGDEEDAGREGRLYLPDTDTAGEQGARLHPASPVRVAGAPALPCRRALSRSLRPFKRRVPSTTRLVLDEDATADRMADESRWTPVLIPAQDRWLDLALVIDAQGDGAALWQPLGRELLAVLHELGAFRHIRTYWLRPRPDGTPGLATGPRRAPRPPATLSDPTGRTVTLLLTDGVDPGWGTGALLGPLRQWSRRGPAAILQALPEHLWAQTALAPEPGRFRSTDAGGGASTRRLHFTPYTLGSRAPEPGEVPVPVLSIRPEWLAPWAHAVVGAGEFDCAAVRLPAVGAAAADAHGPSTAGPLISFEEFLAQTQPGPFRLAAYLSAAPLNLAVMRLVQSAMLPDSPPSDLAEIVFSGLLRKIPARGPGEDPLQQGYEFAPGVRERLLSTLRRDEADQVIASVSAYVESKVPVGAVRFTAAVADPVGSLLLPAGARHWAEVQSLVRRRRRRRVSADETPATTPVGRPAPDPSPAPQHAAPTVLDPYLADDLPSTPHDRGSRDRFLITIGALRSGGNHQSALPGMAEDVVRVRAEFEALGYTTVLPELADDPSASAVLRSIDAWTRKRDRSADAVVVYFAGHASVSDGQAVLMTVDSETPTGSAGAGGLTVPQLHQAFSGRLGGLMLVLDTSFPAVSPLPLPSLWLLSCRQVVEDRRGGSNFARALTAELSGLRRDFSAPADLTELASRIRARMLRQSQWPDPSMVTLNPAGSSSFSRLFFADPRSPGDEDRRPTARIVPTVAQSDALHTILDWLWRQPDDHRPRLVTGSPGCGKTTFLLLLETHMARGRREGADDVKRGQARRIRTVLLSARNSTPGDLWRQLAGHFDFPGSSPRELMPRLATFRAPVALLLDGLDEVEPRLSREIVISMLRPLRTLPNVRLVVTARSALSVSGLGADVEVLHLRGEDERLLRSAEGRALRALSDDDPAVLDHLLALPRAHLIVDGSAATRADDPEASVAKWWTGLLGALSARAAATGAEVTCVFDRAEGTPTVPPTSPRGMRLIFTQSDNDRAGLIYRLVAAEPPGRPVVVASADALVTWEATRAGAHPVPSTLLLRWLSQYPDRTAAEKPIQQNRKNP